MDNFRNYKLYVHMNLIIGLAMVVCCVLGGYMAMGGKLDILFQPFELVIIGGAGAGSFWIANPPELRTKAIAAIASVAAGSPYTKKHFNELLGLMTALFKTIRTKGNLILEKHIENPNDSPIFQLYPRILKNKKIMTFLCDYLRLLSMGTEDPHQVEEILTEELETMHNEHHKVLSALEKMADAFPAMGIVAAVMGVIKAMGAINQPPEILGNYIGAALVGTFLGILLSYGAFGPIAQNVSVLQSREHMIFECIKVALLAHMQNNAPTIAIEFARKKLSGDVRPTFEELEEIILEA